MILRQKNCTKKHETLEKMKRNCEKRTKNETHFCEITMTKID